MGYISLSSTTPSSRSAAVAFNTLASTYFFTGVFIQNII